MTQTRSANLRTMAKSCVIKSMDMACRRCVSFNKVQNLGLYGDIEGGRWLIGDKKTGIVRQGGRDHNALALSAR